jgi:1-acyl-sn-glycerol-3-phosphate acyltransferase
MNEDYKPTLTTRVTRRVLQPVFRLIFHALAHVQIKGLENIPASGGYVIVYNHVSKFDPPLLVAHWPRPPEILGAIEVWDRPGEGQLARLWGGIPVQRGQLDLAAIRRMVSVLRSGYPLMLAPEGGRSHQPGMQLGKPGVSAVIERTMVPVIPVGVIGTTEDFLKNALKLRKPMVVLNIGKPFHIPDDTLPTGKTPKDMRQMHVDLIMNHIASLLPPEYQGVYKRTL